MLFRVFIIFLMLISPSSYAFEDIMSEEEIKNYKGPLSSLSLNPAKGFTVWQSSETLETLSWPSYGNFKHLKTHQEHMPGTLEITVSSFTSKRDFLGLCEGLHKYNVSKLDSSFLEPNKEFKIPGSMIQGKFMGEYLFITLSHDLNPYIIQHIEKESFLKGARRIGFVFGNYDDEVTPLLEVPSEHLGLFQMLQSLEYVYERGHCDMVTGNYEDIFLKTLSPSSHQISTSHLSLKSDLLEWHSEETSSFFPELLEDFGVFVRDSQGKVLGGVIGEIQKEVAFPFAHIKVFFMEEAQRGTGLGKRVMKKVEHFLQACSLKHVSLETMDHQAPWFYEKIGYRRVNTLRQICKGRHGEYLDFHFYVKVFP
ncbi:MAG: GNAT family N-acetyltransferase [Proteobacteria bacterium]|nr:GNAT family N-acetyltransferase [Pseudomonadota bacterium]